MKRLVLFVAVVGLITMAACNKDQAAVKDLSGNWLIKTIDGTDIPFDSALTVTFDKCKLKKDEWCTATVAYKPGDSTSTTEYKVIDDGTTLVQREPGATLELESTITELTNESLTLTTTLFGITTVATYDKK